MFTQEESDFLLNLLSVATFPLRHADMAAMLAKLDAIIEKIKLDTVPETASAGDNEK